LGIPLKSGRLLAETDHNQPRYVIDEASALRFFPNQSAVGQKLLLDVVSAHPQTGEFDLSSAAYRRAVICDCGLPGVVALSGCGGCTCEPRGEGRSGFGSQAAIIVLQQISLSSTTGSPRLGSAFQTRNRPSNRQTPLFAFFCLSMS